ncbi:glycerophosphoryl diester phosphodiesterase membrane domain-containing protein [Streptomyces sp. NPDC003697]
MNDTPGWASPGSAPSDGPQSGASGPADGSGSGQPADEQGAQPQGNGVKWSKDQPPAGQWSAPTGPPAPGHAPPPPPPGAGWGGPPPGHGGYGAPGGYGQPGYGAWGAGWGGPPPAAKPGVIPLRPLGLGEILDGAVSTMRTYWRTVLGISLVVAVITEITVVLVQGLALDNLRTGNLSDPNATPGEVGRAMAESVAESVAGSGAVSLISLIGTVAATALLTTVTSRAVLGRPVTLGEAWRDARPQVLRLFGLLMLLILIGAGVTAVGALPGILVAVSGEVVDGVGLALLGGLGGLVVALWLGVRLSLASPALMLEKQGIKKALGRSVKLVRGSWWRIFGIELLAGLITFLISVIIVIPFSRVAAASSGIGLGSFVDGSARFGWTYLVISGIGSVIASTITFPISAGVTVLLYIDRRIRREGLDLELARAAGVQGHGPGTVAPGS